MWEKTQLSEVFDIGSAKRVLKAQWQSNGIPFYRGREITKLSSYGYVDNELFISEELYEEYKEKYGVPSAGDIVITAIGTIGNSYIVQDQDKFYYKDASVLCLRKKADVDSQFINYWLKSSLMKSQLDEGNGATVDTLTINKMKSLVVLLPPLEEQKRIVGILDEAFEGIDQAIKNTEQNLQNARDLFESYLNNIFTQKGEGWEQDELLNLASNDCSLSYGIVQPGNEVPDGLPVVRPTDLGKRIITKEGLKLIDPSKATSYQRTALHGDELLLCVRGSTGEISFASNELKGANVTRGIVPIRFDAEKVLQEFGYFSFIAKPVKDQVKAGTYGAALMQINIRDLKKIKLLYPSIEVQHKLIIQLNKIQNDCKSLETTYQQKLAALKELKQSLLQKAFAGELTAHDREVA